MINPTWKLYFQFSQKELKGIIALGLILFGSVLLSKFFPSVISNNFNSNALTVVNLFEFDPNQIDSVQALKLGIPEKQVKSLLHYRAKGGYFKNADDFARLYGLSPELFHQLRPYIKMEEREEVSRYHGRYSYYVKHKYKSNYTDRTDLKLDINTADEKEWMRKTQLPLSTVKRIMSYKRYLGAYRTVGQLSKVYGLPDSTYQLIKPMLFVNQNLLPLMNATAMGFNDWKKLGAFTDKQIWTILKLRKENGGRIGWVDLVEACDLTQLEAQELKQKVYLSD
jgi:DNA uptake protein ComE-like DNA-binding protein